MAAEPQFHLGLNGNIITGQFYYLLALLSGALVRRMVAVRRNGQQVFLDDRLLFAAAFFCLVLCWHRYSHYTSHVICRKYY